MPVRAICQVEDCSKRCYRRYCYCRPHHRAFTLYGDPLVVKQQQWHGLSLEQRFLKYVTKTERCWLWQGGKDENGYGRIMVQDIPELVHRVSWTLFRKRRPIPEGGAVLHKCDNPSCVNPAHLFLGTQLRTIADRYRKGRAAQRPGRRQSTLTPLAVRTIRQSDASRRELAEKYHVSKWTISQVRNYRIWRTIL